MYVRRLAIPPESPPSPTSASASTSIGRSDAPQLAILLSLLAICTWQMRNSYIDDALIFSRYAHNLVTGLGWVYNVGDDVNAATSPLFVLTTAAFGLLFSDVSSAMPLTFALPMAALVVMVHGHLRPHGRMPAFLAGLLVVATPRFYYTMGMETALLVALAFGACLASARQRHVVAGCLVGAAILARPDAGVLGILLFVRALLTGSRSAFLFTVATLAIALPWFLHATVAFGSPLPNTLAVKLAQREIWGEPPLFVRGVCRELSLVDERGAGLPPWLVATIFATGLAVLVRKAREHVAPALFAGFAGIQFSAYALADVPPYSWYIAPTWMACTLASGVLVTALWRSRRPFAMLAGAIVGPSLVATAVPEIRAPRPMNPAYESLGRWFAANTSPDATIAAADIGVIGFRTIPRRIIDMHGLVVADAAASIAAGDTGWWFERFTPDYVVVSSTKSGVCERPVVTRADFQRDYRRIEGLPRTGYDIYAHRTVAARTALGSPPPAPR